MKNNSTQMRYEKIMKNIISENEDGVGWAKYEYRLQITI
jgi:hypothetical protein